MRTKDIEFTNLILSDLEQCVCEECLGEGEDDEGETCGECEGAGVVFTKEAE